MLAPGPFARSSPQGKMSADPASLIQPGILKTILDFNGLYTQPVWLQITHIKPMEAGSTTKYKVVVNDGLFFCQGNNANFSL